MGLCGWVRRVNYWSLGDGIVEFASVNLHDDFQILGWVGPSAKRRCSQGAPREAEDPHSRLAAGHKLAVRAPITVEPEDRPCTFTVSPHRAAVPCVGGSP